MERLPIDEVRPGMYLVRSIEDSTGRVLLKAGTQLTERYIQRIYELGYPSIYVGEPWEAEIEVIQPVSNQTKTRVTSSLRDLFTKRGPEQLTDLTEVEQSVNALVDELLVNQSIVFSLSEIRNHDNYTFLHCVDCCVVSVLMARSLRLPTRDIRIVGMGAALHDIGKTLVSQEILCKPARLTKEEYQIVKEHARDGYQMLVQRSSLDYRAAIVALQHHERIDGTGYPAGIQGRDTHIFSRIVAVADVFDAITSDRVYRKGLGFSQARKFLNDNQHQFDESVLSALSEYVAEYPVGAYVKLDSGELGVVIRLNWEHQDQPVVNLIADPTGNRYRKPITVNLASDGRRINEEVISLRDSQASF
ncbi:MAG: HD-GYP domain-containing protein [Limnochordia bacterium]|nr:HD-GYP domain-containing protein [Limnochordia bacterium]MDD4516934.1 HD-GYP domain-containing protein [Limnochordia bacterium]